MVTGAVSERAEAKTSIPYGGRLVLTLLLLALYVLGSSVPLPLVQMEALELSRALERRNLLMLGLEPLILGFILVELFALMTSPGRRLRQSGAAGRARLNRAALITGLLITAVQAAGTAKGLELLSSHGGALVVELPGLGFMLVTVLTLTAVTAAIFAMGQLLSAYGIGNGFALLMLVNVGASIWKRIARGRGDSEDSLVPALSLLVAAGLIMLVFRFVRKAEERWVPAFPQGVVPAQLSALGATLLFLRIFGLPESFGQSRIAPIALALVVIPFFSWLTFHLFSSRPRLQANLSDPEEFLDELAAALRRQALSATALLTFGSITVLAWQEFRPNTIAFSFGFLDVLLVVAIGLDLWDQYRFQKRNGLTALLTQLDNVHFSYRLEELLQEAGIAALARGHHFRSLLFFFGALFKIDVLVPAEQLGHARSVLAELEMAREIRAF
ncbi:MAG TPA: DUF2007 domain-containing protein [Thermoanaerobaculia bacterium]|jgi:hypothetical protein|nr:DUF2007 domain-containing protein [Thermoanaerobaculia bacterium]